MPPTKTAKAIKAMKAYDIPDETVKAVLKDLLQAYEKNWKFIESENYRVLVDAIFDRQDSKSKEVKKQEFRLREEEEEEEEYEQPLKKSCLSKEAEPSQVLFTEVKSKCTLSPGSTPVSPKVFQRKKRLSSESGKSKRIIEFGTGFNGKACAFEIPRDEVPLAIIRPDGSSTGILCDTEQICLEPPKIIHLDAGHITHPIPMGTDDGNSSDAKENDLNTSYISSSDEDDIYHPSQKGDHSTVKRNGLEHPDIIDLDADEKSPSEQACGDGPSDRNSSGLEGKTYSLDSNVTETEHNDNNSPFSSKIEIASSLKGEVKMSFIYNSPLSNKFQIPSLDAVLKHMEDKYHKSFGIFDTGLSLSKLLKDVCECFLEQAPVTMDTEQVPSDEQTRMGPVNVQEPSISCSLAVVQKFCSADMNTLYYVDDITKGNENRKISLVNEFNNEKLAFTYIPKNLTFRSAYVKFVLARISDDNCCSKCSGNCMSLEIPCACAGESGGEFAYTSEGRIKEKFLERCLLIKQKPQRKNYLFCDDCPLERTKGTSKSGKCKGHLMKKFIKECWYKCGCGMNCGNRVVQRGITAYLQVFMTAEGKGWGIRTLTDLPKGAFVCEYVGEIVTNNELFDRNTCNSNEKHTYPVLLDADWSSEGVLRDEEALCLDATSFGNVARFINHRCNDANMVEIPVEVESPDHHYYHLAFFTTREVKALEELTWDYGIDFCDNSHPVKAFKCQCGSKYCRDMKRRKRSRT